MPAYTNISNGLVAVGAKPFATTMQALRDNPLAIAEGDALAPRILDAALSTGAATAAGIAWVGLRTAGLNTGDVGSYALLQYSVVASLAPGATVAGSNLLYSNVDAGASATSPSGTWRLMGRVDASSVRARTSIWLRIS